MANCTSYVLSTSYACCAVASGFGSLADGDDRYKQDFDRDLAGGAEVKSYEYECRATNAAVKGRLKG